MHSFIKLKNDPKIDLLAKGRIQAATLGLMHVIFEKMIVSELRAPSNYE